jgi:hypothetical protein
MLLPDTAELPHITVEHWKGLPAGYVLPRQVDLSSWFPPAGDQGRQSSCVAWALSYGAMSYRKNRWDDRSYAPGTPVDSANTFSPAYLYNLITSFGRSPTEAPSEQACLNGTDAETMLRLAMISGSCPLSVMPYDTTLASCCKDPTAEVMMTALGNQIPPALILGNYAPEQWRYHLAEGRPIIVTIAADGDLVSGGDSAAGSAWYTWSWPPLDLEAFGHAVVCTGYSDDSTFTFLNSWGLGWGMRGYFKATLERLQQKCAGAFVIPTDSLHGWTAQPVGPPDKRVAQGGSVRERIKPGTYQEVNGRKVQLTGVGAADSHALVQLFDAGTDTVLRKVTMHAGQTYAVYGHGRSMHLTYAPRSAVGRWLQRPVRFTLHTVPADEDAWLRERNAAIERLREQLVR